MSKPRNKAFSAKEWAVGEVDQLFVAVARYTRFVLFSKWFLGILALVMLGGLIAFPFFGKDKAGMRVSFVSSDTPQQASSPVMDAPHFIGNDKKNQQYSLTGTRATQETPQRVRIENVQGQLLRANGSMVSMQADSALYYQDSKRVELSGHVTLLDDKGTVFVTDSATISTETMDVDGTAPVEGVGPNGKLVALGFKIRNNGNDITFGATPRVTVVIEKMRRDR